MKLNRLLLTGATCLISILSVSGSADRVLANSPSKTEANTVVAQMKQTVQKSLLLERLGLLQKMDIAT